MNELNADVEPTTYQINVKVLDYIELAYNENKEITVNLVKSKGAFSLKVDQNGNATLTGKAGIVRFSVNNTGDKIGFDLKCVSIMFFGERSGRNLHYSATFGLDRSVRN